jgi:ABC-type bacteriocin/lantibiotic exporter with double-glycine peptidase domain
VDVPFVHQVKDGCGSASVAMLMQYWIGKHAAIPSARSDPVRIQQELYSRAAHGIFASAIEEYLRGSGFTVYAFRGEWRDLREHVTKGRPLLVGLKPGRGTELHYAVVVGVSSKDDAVFLNDPARSKLDKIDRAKFTEQWGGTGYWTLLAVPKQP